MMRARMDVGKLPNEMLAELLGKVQSRDPRVLLGPGIGRDAAVIDAGGPKLLVAKSDPITFATDLIGWYAVHVNANDVACLGARPAWCLATILLPQGATPELARSIFDQVLAACEGLGVELVGGHTEITYRLERPIVVGALLGEVEREGLVTPDGARPGDALVLTKGIAIEGTAVLAREAGPALQRLGVPVATVRAAKEYILEPGISVVREAAAACGAVRVHAMHDPTEGGLATALYELAEAAGLGLVVQEESIEVLALTEDVCRAAGLAPLGLLASGALLLAVAEEDCRRAVRAIEDAGVPARRIGALVRREEGVIMEARGHRKKVPRFARDEVARFLAELGEEKAPIARGSAVRG
ncbi:MAG TPA: AIR synthase-related protein [Dehalococcoidia bacterium]|nr:AIR synthase-related protein [Dehalococcoidia bacterium]